ncbi:MAG: hypothetical protein K9N62_19080 [Verrucomicrobia bacterium]|nr:hypothetical protein [Verrucomicrobiota bacterium]
MTAGIGKLGQLPRILSVQAPDLELQIYRIRYVERNIGLLVKAAVILVLFFYLFVSNWYTEVDVADGELVDAPPQIVLNLIRQFFLIYFVINVAAGWLLGGMRHLPADWIQWTVFVVCAVDTLFLSALSVMTGGYDSILFWVFLGLVVRNSISNPSATRQIILNLFVSVCYLLAGAMDVISQRWETRLYDERILNAIEQNFNNTTAEPFLLRLCLLLLMSACCFGVQVLMDKQRAADSEAREFELRQEQLQATGRLAAEIAHQLKNPLGIINNAAFSLQRSIGDGSVDPQQIVIIREEVERSDRILTELMGYARLTEGKVERLSVSEELDQAIAQVFPKAAKYDVIVQREYGAALPPLLMERNHLSEVFVNILHNARDAIGGKGTIRIQTRFGENFAVIIRISDDGPGMTPENVAKIFEPYFTTKSKGTGLGLAIVKHNTEIYGGTVGVESELGKGTRFTIRLPAKTFMRIRK